MKQILSPKTSNVSSGISDSKYSADLSSIFVNWLAKFEESIGKRDIDNLRILFLPDCYWRDQIGLTWDMRQYWGRDNVLPALVEATISIMPSRFRIAEDRTAPRIVPYLETEFLEGFCEFDLPHGVGQALVRLQPDTAAPAGALCFSIGTDLRSVNGIGEQHARKILPDKLEPVFPIHGFEPHFEGQTWPEFLEANRSFEGRHPDILIVGGGHTGVMIGARLHAMGLSYLIVDKNDRPGDSWRARYDSLALHTVGATNQLPYVPTPDVYPDYIPKDRWADWIESYSRIMALNYWSSSELITGRFDEDAGRWTCEVRRDGEEMRTIRPVHVVLALGGLGSEPFVPQMPGLSDFAGDILHSKQFRTGRDFAGKRVLVVGTSTSGHDIALDLYNKKAAVTMLQRGPTMVARLVEGVKHNENYVAGKMSVDEADQRRGANNILPLRTRFLQLVTQRSKQDNAPLHESLEKAGLRLTDGPDGTGWLGKLAREFKGFYINMGCADVIAEGGIKIIQTDDFDRFTADGALMQDGALHSFDAIIFATGFFNQNQQLIGMFGEDVAQRVGPCSGFDANGEQYGNAKPLHQRQMWQIYGGINDSRRLSKILALQLGAQLTGKVPPLERQSDGMLKPCPPPSPL